MLPCTAMCSKILRKFGETLYANDRYKQIVYTGHLLIYKYISIKSKQYREKGLSAMLDFFLFISPLAGPQKELLLKQKYHKQILHQDGNR